MNNTLAPALVELRFRGLAHFDAPQALLGVIIPALLPLIDQLLVPYFLARCIGWWCCTADTSAAYTTSVLLVRYCYHAYQLLRLLMWLWNKAVIVFSKSYAALQVANEFASAQLINRN